MKKSPFVYGFLCLLLLLAACQSPVTPAPTALPPTVAPTVAPTATPVPAAPVLTLVKADGSPVAFTLADLQALPVSEGFAGIKSSTGKITPPEKFSGVSLKDLAATLGDFADGMGLNVVAEDGYGITFSYDQVMNGSFIAYDPATGDELPSAPALTAMIAYARDGQPLDAKSEGTLRLVIVSSEATQVTDGHWAVKWTNQVEAKSLALDWTVRLEGALSEDMDRATFESGASPNCHAQSWTDDKAQEWIGMPLWYLVGRVDDDIRHNGPAFNDALADAGYTVDVVASDGYVVSFDSARVKRNNNILVAYLVNGNPLPEKYFPLRLVGSDLQKNEMTGMVAKIVVHLGAASAATPTVAVETPVSSTTVLTGGLYVLGLVAKPLAIADLRQLELVQVTAEHPKKGPQEYAGVRLATLLEMAQAQATARKLVLTAADGYSAEVFLAEVQACADCMIAIAEDGQLSTVMPGMPGNFWIKDIAQLEVK